MCPLYYRQLSKSGLCLNLRKVKLSVLRLSYGDIGNR